MGFPKHVWFFPALSGTQTGSDMKIFLECKIYYTTHGGGIEMLSYEWTFKMGPEG